MNDKDNTIRISSNANKLITDSVKSIIEKKRKEKEDKRLEAIAIDDYCDDLVSYR